MGGLTGQRDETGRLAWLCTSRVIVSISYMMFAGALPQLTIDWRMTSPHAGLVQAAFNVSYAISLVLSGWLSDRFGAKRLFLWASGATAVVGMLVAIFARSFESGVILFGLFGLCHGGTYTPSLMLVTQRAHPDHRGLFVGLLIGSSSVGYAGSIALVTIISALVDYRAAFAVCGCAPAIAAVAAWLGAQGRNVVPVLRTKTLFKQRYSNASLLLTLGYTAHCWELLGMWAWMPAFLLLQLGPTESNNHWALGMWIGIAIHLSGGLAAFTMGYASDRIGRRAILILLGCLGAICSVSAGWLAQSPASILLPFAALYGFSAIGDSPVLSTAIAESVAPESLGSTLAIRSLLGFGAGGLAPLAFGVLRDASPAGYGWVFAFSCLALGGVLATVFAFLLPRADIFSLEGKAQT
jgi:MFS family permease